MRSHLVRALVLAVVSLGLAACGGGGGGGHKQPPVPASITIVSGNGQSGSVGTELPAALSVSVNDSLGRAVAGATVTWTVTAGGGSVTPASSVTDSGGVANTRWTLGTSAGANRATATVAGVVPTTFDATAIAVPVVLTSIAVTGVPSAPMMPGNSAQLSAVATYSDQSTKVVTTEVAWSATDTTVLTVTATGQLAANEPGQAVVIAALSGISGSANVQVVPLTISAYELRLTGQPEIMIAEAQFGLYNVPDEHMSFRRTASGIDLWLAGMGGAVRLQGATFETLTPNPSANGTAVPVFLPSGSGFDRDYAGPGSVLTAANGTDLLMIYHAEYDCGAYGTPFTAGIGLARSTDGGLTWTRQGQIISSSYQPPHCTAARLDGAGIPVVVLSRDGDYYYLYYMEWFTDRPDQTYLARSPVSADAAPGSWTKYYRGEFSQPGLGGLADPVIRRPDPEDVTIWAGFASVSYNTVLQRYLAVFMTTPEFYYTASEDGIHWEPARKLGLLTQNIPGAPPGTWLSYPSLLSLDQPNDRTTTGSGYLYYSSGILNVAPHHMERRAFELIVGRTP